MSKKAKIILILLAILIMVFIPTYANDYITIVVDGEVVEFPYQKPMIEPSTSRTIVPVKSSDSNTSNSSSTSSSEPSIAP